MSLSSEAVVDQLKLLNAMVRSKGVQQIVDIGFQLLGNPMLLTDANHKLLAYTKDVEINDRKWHDIVELGYVSYSIVSGIYKDIFSTAKQYPVIDAQGSAPIPLLRKIMMIEDKVAAHLTIPGYFRPFDAHCLEMAELVSNLLLKEMQTSKFTRFAKGGLFEAFVNDLLSGKILNQSIIDKRLNFLDWNLKEYIYVLTVTSKPTDSETISVADTIQALQDLISDSRAVLYNNDVVVVFSRSKEITRPEIQFSDLQEFLSKKRLKAGVSRSTRSVADIQNCYLQSTKAIEIGSSVEMDKTIYTYEDYTIDYLLDICAAQKKLKDFCHPALLTLAEYDRKYATDFVASLRAYLEHNRNIVETAIALHIHRNTMSYRISKIAEVMKLDLSDSNITMRLFLSLMMLNHIKDN